MSFPIDIETELNVIKADKYLSEQISKAKKIVKINRRSLLILVANRDQVAKLEKFKEICSYPVEIQPHRTLNNVKGTAYSETLSQSTEGEILEQLRNQGVIDVKRMKRRMGKELVDTNRYILTFSGTYLPSLITVTAW